jgi:dipeptidyl aminopeptidase/acylaminoacyl peptidase
VLFPTLKGVTLVWAEDGKHYAFAKDGRLRVASVDDTTSRLVAGPAPSDTSKLPTDSVAADSVRKAREALRFTPLRLSRTGDALIASNKDGLWFIDVATAKRDMFLPTPDSTLRAPTRSVLAWSGDGRYVYLSHASRQQWERGILRYDRERQALDTLALDARTYGNFQLARNGGAVVLTIADVARPGDLYVADASLKQLRRLVHTNPQLDGKELGSASLMDYLDADGHRKYGVVYYPAGYQKGTRYPTVFNIYEDFFNDAFDPVINVLNANGYVVVQPSVDFDIGYPGEAWVKGVTSAANKLIETGVADSAKLGVHGTSYGGYATNLLITQTNRFKAAINISGKVDIISFYTDSPRLGVRNIHAAEKSQDRIGATLWQQPQKYVQHSAIMFADRIQTPLLLMTGGQDSNVPADNTREMYYALRRLGKEVVWANYINGGHGAGNASVDDYVDYVKRIVSWYDDHLKTDAKKKVAATDGSF